MPNPLRQRPRIFCASLALLTSITAAAAAESDAGAFTCTDAFDLIATAVNIHCARAPATIDKELTSAKATLLDAGFIAPHEAATVALAWCPLEHVLGFTPDAAHIFINEDLEKGGTALLAEVVRITSPAAPSLMIRIRPLRGRNSSHPSQWTPFSLWGRQGTCPRKWKQSGRKFTSGHPSFVEPFLDQLERFPRLDIQAAGQTVF